MASLESSNPATPNQQINVPIVNGLDPRFNVPHNDTWFQAPDDLTSDDVSQTTHTNHTRASHHALAHHSQSSGAAATNVVNNGSTTGAANVSVPPSTGAAHGSNDLSGGVILVFFILLIPGTYFFVKLIDKSFNWVIEKTQNFSGIEQFFLALARYCVISAAVLTFGMAFGFAKPFSVFWLYVSYVFALVAIEVPRLLYYKLRGKSYTPSIIFRWGILAGSLGIFVRFIWAGNGGGTEYHSSSSTNYVSSYRSSLDVAPSSLDINPATGHLMMSGTGGVDSSGNSYGSSGF